MARPRLLLDVDTGIDDAIMLLYLGRQDAEIVAIGTVHGNCTADQAAFNTLLTLERAGMSPCPVAVGARRPLAQPLSVSADVHGGDGLGNAGLGSPAGQPSTEAAAAQLVRLARENPGELTVLATGPLTNLALALLLEPALPRLVRRVVVMGGAVSCPGNATPQSEANIWHDPEAADLVLSADWDLTLVGLDVTMQAVLRGERLEQVSAADTASARFATAILSHYLDVYEHYLGERASAMHDPLAAAVALDPSYVGCVDMAVHVELRGQLSRGSTLADLRGFPADASEGRRPAHVAMRVDRERFLDDLVQSLVRPPA